MKNQHILKTVCPIDFKQKLYWSVYVAFHNELIQIALQPVSIFQKHPLQPP